MEKKTIILVGGGGHCSAVIDVIESTGKWEIVGILDVANQIGKTNLGYPVIAEDEEIQSLANAGHDFMVTVGQIKSAAVRQKLFDACIAANANLPLVIASSAYVSKHATVGKGSVIMHHALVNANASIGENCILNTKCLVEHDATVGDHCHVSTGAIVNGDCTIGNNVFIGSNAVIAHGVTICNDTVVAAGAGVFKDVVEPGTLIGNPSRFLKK